MNLKEFRALAAEARKRGRPPRMKYTFAVGAFWDHVVSVRYAGGLDGAMQLASTMMDSRAARSGVEPPVAWDLTLIELVPDPAKSWGWKNADQQ